MKKRLVAVLMALSLGLSLAVTGCGQAASSSNVIKIGFIGPLTGDVKTFGQSTQNAFNLAIKEAGGKVGDYTIQTFSADDANDATQAVNVATQLITQDHVAAIVGSVTSKATLPIAQVANDNKVVLITPTATATNVTVDNGARKDYVFRACFIDPFQGQVAAQFATQNLKAKTAAIMYDQTNPYSKGLAGTFSDNFAKDGGKVLSDEAYSTTDTDFSAVLTTIAQLKPDILYLPDYYNKVSLIGKQARAKGIKATFMGGDGWDSSQLDFATMDGGYFTNHYSADDPRPEVQKWVADYKAAYGATPDALATLAYDATNLLLNAIRTAGSNDPTKIRDAMQATKDFPVVSGKITFDQNGNPIKAAVVLEIKGGKEVYAATVQP
ncbi:MAG TPA: ABC transporter substrate-binding protein [Spirochaetia bacterium]|nr:ABC transporter substrate-binding protein [Spirochaetia bacterium]